MIISVPRLNDEYEDFQRMFAMQEQANGEGLHVSFDFSKCDFLRPNAIAFLGALAKSIESKNGQVTFEWNTCDSEVLKLLLRNEFVASFPRDLKPMRRDSVPYREHRTKDRDAIMQYLRGDWLGRGWVDISPRLRSLVLGNVWEIYENAFGHSLSPVGVFSCGQYYRRLGTLQLSVVDFGIGIVANVQNYWKRQIAEVFGEGRDEAFGVIKPETALEWAFASGHSTKAEKAAAGLGLKLLKQFIMVNKGCLKVFSNDAYVQIDEHGEQYLRQTIPVQGTIVNISLKCDNSYYCLADEAIKEK